jgi:uncharacterized membrane protein
MVGEFAHLRATARLHHVVLFATVLLWAIALFAVSRPRDRREAAVYPAGTAKGTALTVIIGVVAWVAFALWLHLWLIGVNPMA